MPKLTPRGEAAQSRKTVPVAETIEEAATEPTCLVCLTLVDLIKGRPGQGEVVADHTHSHDPQIFTICRGSGHVPVQHDGRDELRVQAVLKYADIQRDIAEERAKFVADMTEKDWPLEALVALDAEKIIVLESTATIWEFMIDSGDWWATLSYALTKMDLGAGVTADPLVACQRRGFRRWIVSNRVTLSRLLVGSAERDADADSVRRAPGFLADLLSVL